MSYQPASYVEYNHSQLKKACFKKAHFSQGSISETTSAI